MKFFFLFFLFIAGAQASSLTLDSRYFPYGDQQQDMRGIPQFGYEVTGLRGKVLEHLTRKTLLGDSALERSLLFFGSEIVGGYLMDLSFITSYHEFGHASRVAALGYGYSFDGNKKDFFSYYLFKFGSNGGVTYTEKRNFKVASRFVRGTTFTDLGRILVSSGGLNAGTAYAGYLGQKAKDEGAHVSHFFSYTYAKLNPALYPEKSHGVRFGDVANILSYYRRLGVGDFESGDLKNMSYVSYVLSSSTWEYLRAVGNYIRSGEMKTKPEQRKWALPDFESYVTSKGLSMKMISSFTAHESFSVPFGIEHVFRGKHVTEYSLGASYFLDKEKEKRLTSSLVAGLALGWKLDYELNSGDNTVLNLGFNLDQLNSLDGERNIISLRKGEVAISPYLKWSAFF